jgi:tetratricopeptide (TPR) repeat protein
LSLGGQEPGTVHLEEAIATFRAVLVVWTRGRSPLAWAVAQNDLGNALRALGERESGTAHLEEAIAANRAVLEVRTRERLPLYWASTQYNLRLALRTLGERESGSAHLEEAITAWEACLTVTNLPQSRVHEVCSRIDQARAEKARRTAK